MQLNNHSYKTNEVKNVLFFVVSVAAVFRLKRCFFNYWKKIRQGKNDMHKMNCLCYKLACFKF